MVASWQRRMQLLPMLLVGAASSGCGGADAQAVEPDDASASPGARCLADARAPRVGETKARGKIGVRHILVRHSALKDSRGATRTPEQACLRALDALQQLTAGGLEWGEAVSMYSDASTDDLGRVAYEDLNASFASAAFRLEIDQLSYVVESDRGFHVIWRTE